MQPVDGREKWIELEEMELDLLELAGRSLSVLEMVEEVVEERLSQRDDDDDDDEFDFDDEDDDEEGGGEEEEEEGVEMDDEETENLRVEAVTEDVLGALRSLYQKRLIAFDE